MDKLKKYLRDHEVDMEFDIPDENVWERIEADIPGTLVRGRMIQWIKRLAIAACIVGAIGIAAYYWVSPGHDHIVKSDPAAAPKNIPKEENIPGKVTNNYQPAPGIAVTNPPDAGNKQLTHSPVRSAGIFNKTSTAINKEVVTISNGYTRLINYKLKELRSTAVRAENPAYFSSFTSQFRKMERDERRLRADLNKYGVTDELLEQLINLYQQKLNVLKILQAEIKKMNNKVIENKNASPTGDKYYLDI